MKNLVKYTSILLLLLLIKTGSAQQYPSVYNIYTQTRFLYNPAHTGEIGQAFFDVKENYLGIKGAQEMFTFGVHSAVGAAKKSGLGLFLQYDKRNVEARTAVNANYSYAAKLNDANTLSFGAGLGVMDHRYDQGKMIAAEPGEIVGDINNYELTRLSARFGINYNWNQKLNVGFALPEMITDNNSFNKHFLGMASYKLYALQEKLEIEPVVLYRHHIYNDGQYNQLDLNLYTCWDQTFWLQGAYRINPSLLTSAFYVGGGVNLANIGLGYAYELGMGNDLATISNGTHEVQLVIFFDKDRKKNNNEALLNNNQLEMMVDSVPQEVDYQEKLDSLNKELENLKNAMQMKEVGEMFDRLLERIKELDAAKEEAIIKTNPDVVVFFDINKYNIRPEYIAQLDALADELKTTNAVIQVHGYADESGAEQPNQVLSEKRAEAVKDYLVRKGVKAGNLITSAHGETTNFGQSLDSNRRVEFKR